MRLAHPKTRLEAITSRPKLLSAVGRMTRHAAGQKKILLTIAHEAAVQIKRLIVNVRAGLSHVRETAPQLDKPQRWFALVRYIVERILACQPKPNPGADGVGKRVTEENRLIGGRRLDARFAQHLVRVLAQARRHAHRQLLAVDAHRRAGEAQVSITWAASV